MISRAYSHSALEMSISLFPGLLLIEQGEGGVGVEIDEAPGSAVISALRVPSTWVSSIRARTLRKRSS